ncbi:MAG: VWA domain-containing protein [Candidatus Solibacter sp.]|nr:VWA domain-containing protein [Candidatus Solibacter sp.]
MHQPCLMRAFALLLLTAAIVLLTATIAGAQFKSTATLVIAPTTITDSRGSYIDALEPADLVLYDNGVRQPIQVDEAFNAVSLVVAVQTSANSAAILDKLGTSGILFTDLLAGDRGETALVTFSDEVRSLRDFTTNSDNLSAGLRSLHVQGTGAVALEAVMQSLAMLARRKSDRRRILLVIAEKRDRSSKVKFPVVLQEAQRQNVLIYWLTYSPFLQPFTAGPKKVKSRDPTKDGEPLPPDMAPGNLLSVFSELAHQGKPDNSVQLTRATGGRAIGFTKKEALEEAIQAIASEVHRQYIVSFTPPPGKPGEYHALRIEVKGHGDLTARTRAGYWAMP